MLLPTAHCPHCKRETLVHRTVAADADPRTAELEWRCVDCDGRLDRFGATPQIDDKALPELKALGYDDLDKPRPIGPGGCFEAIGCEGCPKIETRPW